eukprot:GHVT01005657.1.p1 GENE.GHVT01005657.1~~GHVT01005657.1.p1  ORF type:complete len:187 (+),score=2.90 GHVT01005657.1:145-705(+)
MDEPDGYNNCQQDLQTDGEAHMPMGFSGSMKGNTYGGKNSRDSGCIVSVDSCYGSSSIISGTGSSSMVSDIQKDLENMDITNSVSDSTDSGRSSSSNARVATDDSVTSKNADDKNLTCDEVCESGLGHSLREESILESLDSCEKDQNFVEEESEHSVQLPQATIPNYPSYFDIVNRCYGQDEEGDT